MSDKEFMPASRKLYEYMVENDAEVYPGDEQLAKNFGYHKRTLSNAVHELEDAGYIIPSHVGTYGRHYRAVADKAQEELPRPDRPKWQTEEWLHKKYVHEGLTTTEVAKIAGVSQMSIYNHLTRNGIDTTRTISSKSGVLCCELGSGFRSRWEHKVAHRLEDAGVDWKHEPYQIETSDRTYLPDFVCGDTIIEVKGRVYEENDQCLALEELMADGYQIVVVGGAEAEGLPHDEFISYDGGACEGLIAALDD